MVKQRVPTYSMKMRIYPTPDQKNKIDAILRALHLAYNMTFHEVFQKNPAVCTAPNAEGAVWPDFRKMIRKEWKEYLISQNPAVGEAPATSLVNQNGLFALDAKRAWEIGMNKAPVNPERRKDFRFYHAGKPRRSFFVQVVAKNLVPSPENDKVAWITLPKIGRVKARGFNRRLWFGEGGQHDYAAALLAGELPSQLSVRVSKDTCGDCYVSVTFSEGQKKDRILYLEMPAAEKPVPVGVDVGIKDIAILSTGEKIENKQFKRQKSGTLTRLNRELSRRWGPANMAYRDYNRAMRKENRENPETASPLAQPSRRYLATQRKKALVEWRIARRRDTYYHQQTAALTRKSSVIAIETLLVRNMVRNHKLAYALADAAMSDFLAKVTYKAARRGVEVLCVGMFEPTSQLCSACGEQYPAVKDLSVRAWTCPKCGERHDRDVNAARNILRLALQRGGVRDDPLPLPERKKAPSGKPRSRKGLVIFPDRPEIVVVFSRELTGHNDPRYVVRNTKTNRILDDAQGAGYRSASNAKNCYKAKVKWAGEAGPEQRRKEQ